jgi:hypothetical protein
VRSGDERTARATVRVAPASAADGAHFLNVTAWQGGASVVDELEEVGPGVYRATEPIPVHGSWKTMVRLHRGESLVAVPIYLPRDRAIPAPKVPARPEFTRQFVRDIELLQRERKDDVPAGLALSAYLAVAAIAASLIVLFAWVLLRLEGRTARNIAETSASLPGTPSPRSTRSGGTKVARVTGANPS